MKSFCIIHFRIGVFLLLLAICSTIHAQNTYITVNGYLEDAKTHDKISHATITIPNTGIGTVSNSEGEFTLKVDSSLHAEYFEVSHVSYATAKFKISEAAGEGKTFYLDIQPVQLKEVPVMPDDARAMVQKALKNIGKNYSDLPEIMTGFYRECVMQRHDYLSVSEAVINIYKASYTSGQDDQVKIYKGRRSSNVKKADTLMVKLQGGPDVLLMLDIVKHTDLSIGLDNLDNYNFEFGPVVYVDDKPNRIISFSPRLVTEDPLYNGKLYISQDNMAMTRAEFSIDLSDPDKASQAFVRKKPAGMVFMPTATSYLLNYKEQNGKFYLNYVRIDLKFKCDWKRRLFKNNYTLMSEVAITDRSNENVTRFPSQDVFRSNMILAEKVQDFNDVDFWGENNIIEPEKSIENAILKLSKSKRK